MTPRKQPVQAWPFGRKFDLWLTDHGLTLTEFARAHGLRQQNLHRWVKKGVRVPADAMRVIENATRIPAAYWMDGTLPYPLPQDYADMAEQVATALKAVPLDELRELLAIIENADARRRALAVWRAARGL